MLIFVRGLKTIILSIPIFWESAGWQEILAGPDKSLLSLQSEAVRRSGDEVENIFLDNM